MARKVGQWEEEEVARGSSLQGGREDVGEKSNQSSEFSLTGFQKEKYPEEFSLLKSQTKDGQRPEWTFYPRFSSNIHTYHVGKQCFFGGVFWGNRRSVAERTVDKSLGRKKYEFLTRKNSIHLSHWSHFHKFPKPRTTENGLGVLPHQLPIKKIPYRPAYNQSYGDFLS
ncbi:hypothetical protein STEG23_020037 [Scotinomys teguina]